jgi:release factor glutamine methyltransferase
VTARADANGADGGERTVTWRELLAETAALLDDATHARWVCETATATAPDEFRAMLDQPATERAVAHLDAMVARARAGEPIQYVLGSWAFRHLDLAIDERVLIPRPETELVAELAIEFAATAGPIRHVVDLGTGSGAIGLALADELPHDGTRIWITDASVDALTVARDNLAGLGRSATNVTAVEGSWYDALPDGVRFDVVVSNPPYVADASIEIEHIVGDWEPSAALFAGPDGLDDLRTIIHDAPRHLRPNGRLVLEHGHDQGAAVRELMVAAGLVDTETRPDLAGLDRLSIGRRPSHLFDVAWDAGELSVRHLHNTISDYAHLLQWLTTPEVLEWYEGRDKEFDLAVILAEYGPGGEQERDGTIPAVIELDGDPIGYVQLYELDDPADAAAFDLVDGRRIWSLDLFIGRPDLFGIGIGRAVCRAAAEHLVADHGARDVVITPYVENARAIAAYRAAGFEGDHIVLEHELHEGVMRDALRLHFRP